MTGDGVSVVIPVYNAGAFIRDALESVYLQKDCGFPLEVLLVDDGSTDKSREVIEEWGRDHIDLDIRLLENTGTKGPAGARNTGIGSASQRYIAFLDSDDLWLNGKLKTQISFMKKRDCAFSFTSYEFGDENAHGTGRTVRAPAKLDYSRALTRTVIFTSTVVLDREKTGPELLMMQDVPSEDTAEWWKLLRNGYEASGLDRVFTIYRRSRGTLSSNKVNACRRIWNLYRRVEGLSVLKSASCFVQWAFRATLRRV